MARKMEGREGRKGGRQKRGKKMEERMNEFHLGSSGILYGCISVVSPNA